MVFVYKIKWILFKLFYVLLLTLYCDIGLNSKTYKALLDNVNK